MAEALFFAGNNTVADTVKDRLGAWKRGYIVTVKPDGHQWGAREDPAQNPAPRKFALIKFPGVSVARVEKYLAEQLDPDALAVGVLNVRYRRRLWQLQFAELPARARNLLSNQGVLTIGPDGDFTWPQVRNFWMRLDTLERETEGM